MSELQVVKEIESINELLSRHGKSAIVDIHNSFVSSKGDICRYVIHTTERVSTIKSFVAEVQQAITGLRGQKTAVEYDMYYGAFVMPHPHPTNLMWDGSILEALTPMQFVAGRQYEGKRSGLLTYQLNDARYAHILVSGTTGSGKSSLFACIGSSLAYGTSPKKLRFILIDPKNSEYMRPLSALPHTYSLIKDPAKAVDRLNAVVNELDRRIGNGVEPDFALVVFIDELAELVDLFGDAVQKPLKRITQVGRDYGVHIIAATQKVLVETVGSTAKSNLPLRFLGKMVSTSDSTSAAGNGAQTYLIETPGVFYAVSGEPIRIRTYYLGVDALQEEIKRINERWEGVTPADIQLATMSDTQVAPSAVSTQQILAVLGKYSFDDILKEDGTPVRGIKTKLASHLYKRKYAGDITQPVDNVIDLIGQLRPLVQKKG